MKHLAALSRRIDGERTEQAIGHLAPERETAVADLVGPAERVGQPDRLRGVAGLGIGQDPHERVSLLEALAAFAPFDDFGSEQRAASHAEAPAHFRLVARGGLELLAPPEKAARLDEEAAAVGHRDAARNVIDRHENRATRAVHQLVEHPRNVLVREQVDRLHVREEVEPRGKLGEHVCETPVMRAHSGLLRDVCCRAVRTTAHRDDVGPADATTVEVLREEAACIERAIAHVAVLPEALRG